VFCLDKRKKEKRSKLALGPFHVSVEESVGPRRRSLENMVRSFFLIRVAF